jgi:hypothetical protein
MERKFELKPEFKAMALEALSKLSFSQVHQVAGLIKRETTVYTETEANAVVGFLGEMAYRDVAHIFEAMPKLVVEVTDENPEVEEPQKDEAVAN